MFKAVLKEKKAEQKSHKTKNQESDEAHFLNDSWDNIE
jgi:hypothetical protein